MIKVHLKPHSDLGLWTILLMGSFFTLIFFTKYVTIGIFHQKPGNSIINNAYISIPMKIAYWAGVTAFFSGIISIKRNKERSIIVLICTILGFLIACYLLSNLTI